MLIFAYQLKTNNMTIEETFKLANDIKNKFPELSNWRISFHNKKRSLGTCKYSTREILISKSILPFMSDYGIKMTILHEIAHALTPRHGHDYYWKMKCISIGGVGCRVSDETYFINGKNSTVEHKELTAKYIYTCPVCGHKEYRYRATKSRFSCGLHGKGFNEKYLMILDKC